MSEKGCIYHIQRQPLALDKPVRCWEIRNGDQIVETCPTKEAAFRRIITLDPKAERLTVITGRSKKRPKT